MAKEKYKVHGKPCRSFKEAASLAVDSALESRESVSIEELDQHGNLLGYVIVTASTETP
jgi:chromosome condensin MukBEF MukE localization factor